MFPDETPIDLVSNDVKMGEPNAHANGVNGNHMNGDVDMHDDRPAMKNGDASSPASSSRERPNDEDDEQPPAKRARMLSDADKTSMTHVSLFSLSYAVTGVLIRHAFRRPSEVRHSSPSVG